MLHVCRCGRCNVWRKFDKFGARFYFSRINTRDTSDYKVLSAGASPRLRRALLASSCSVWDAAAAASQSAAGALPTTTLPTTLPATHQQQRGGCGHIH